MRSRAPAILAAVFLSFVVLDQVTKWLVRHFMITPGASISVLGDVLRVTYVRNTGAAFGILPGHGGVFIVVELLVLLGIAIYWWKVRPTRTLLVVALGLLAAGAVGNLIDRTTAGLVTDFIEVPFWPVFNVADSCTVVGAILLEWWILFGPADHRAAVGAVETTSDE